MTQPPPSDNWQADIQALWEQGQRQTAIDRLLARINAARPAVPRKLGLQFVYYLFLLGDLAAAEHFLGQLRQAHPDDTEVLENLAVVLSRQGKAIEALPCFEQVVQQRPESANAWDGLTACCARLGRFEQAREAGERALALKTEAARPLADWAPPAGSPRLFLQRPGTTPRRDVIAFSLWGANPRYLRGALRNALLIPELYPGWLARFYLDESVPGEFQALLVQLGADCRRMPSGGGLRQRLCWRFLVAGDEGVGRFLVRDCDAVVSQREVAAVREWIASDHWFHVMRDWWTHTDPILAGMWGGIAGVLPLLEPLLTAYQPAARETANVDQWFLRDVVWGSVGPLALVHDRCFRSAGSRPWPDADEPDERHVGQDEFAVGRRQQAIRLAGWMQRLACLRLEGEDPESLLPQPRSSERDLVISRWRQPSVEKLTSGAPPPMPERVTGRVLNLDRATQRWQGMAAQIEALGWGKTHQRFAALAASQEEAQAHGLPSAGYLGLWRTTRALLEQWLGEDPDPDQVLHLIEDDAVLHPQLPAVIEPFLSCSPALDLLFTEAFLTVPLYQQFRDLEQRRLADGVGFQFINGGQYLACASSVLISVRGGRRLLDYMEAAEAKGKIPVNDIFYRNLIRSGVLSAAITLPFFSTIAFVDDSAIQTGLGDRVAMSKSVDLALRRLLYFQAWQPEACGGVLQEIASVLASGLNATAVENAVLELLRLGAAKGWLSTY